MSEFKRYRKKQLQEMRPYVNGEDTFAISISEPDRHLPTLEGGMIARNPQNHADQWYVSKAFFEANYEEVAKSQGTTCVRSPDGLHHSGCYPCGYCGLDAPGITWS